MADRLELLLEAERRGILPAEQAALLAEARKRGLVDSEEPTSQPVSKPNDTVATPEASKARLGSLMGFTPQNTPEQFASFSKSDVATALPFAGGMAGAMMIPGTGLGALALQSLGAAGGATAGELGRQAISGEAIDPIKAGKEGAIQGAGNLVGGGSIKALGATARAMFSSKFDEGAKAAAKAAEEMGAPFPAGQVSPSTLQKAGSQLTLGRFANQHQAVRVAQHLNRTVGTLTEKAQVFDEAALTGQQFLREVFGEGETAIRNAFTKYGTAVGKETPIPTANTLVAVQQAADRLAARGQTAGGLYQRLRTILKKNPNSLTTEEFDELYGGIIKQSFSSKGRAGGEGRILLDAITQDLDNFGRQAGVKFGEDIAAASKIREQYRALRDIPQLKKLSEEFGGMGAARGSIDWMNTLFRKENGAALGKLRELNPSLYHDLADAWLARHIDSFTQHTQGNIGKVLNGDRMRVWFEQNSDTIKEIFGGPQHKALDNFSLYARYMSAAARRADTGVTGGQAVASGLLTSGLGGGAFMSGALPLVIPTEAAAFVLARGVTKPGSTLFRLFTEGFSEPMKATMRRAGQFAGQAGARGRDENTR